MLYIVKHPWWEGKTEKEIRDLMENEIDDWKFDNGEEMDDLRLDGDPYFDDESGYLFWDAEDDEHCYSLVDCGDGLIEIHYSGAK